MDIQTKLCIGVDEIEIALRDRYGIGLNSEFDYDTVAGGEPMVIGQKHLNAVRVTIWGEYNAPKDIPQVNLVQETKQYTTATEARR